MLVTLLIVFGIRFIYDIMNMLLEVMYRFHKCGFSIYLGLSMGGIY